MMDKVSAYILHVVQSEPNSLSTFGPSSTDDLKVGRKSLAKHHPNTVKLGNTELIGAGHFLNHVHQNGRLSTDLCTGKRADSTEVRLGGVA